MDLLGCSALLLALGAAFGQGYTGCKPVYVRWSKAALDKTSRVSGNYALEDCQKACSGQYHPANERYKFACSSFNFRQNPTKSSDQECELFRADQLRDVDHDIVAREDFSFYRRHCVKTKKTCKSLYQFDLVVDSYMEQSEISRKLPARNVEDCLANCLEETGFQCRSVSYNRTGFECQLSSQNSVSKPGKVRLNNNPNYRIDYYENNCVNDSFSFSHTCGPNGITVKVESKAPYTGALYGLYDYFTCRSEPKDATLFDHYFPYSHIAKNCSGSMNVQNDKVVLDVVLSADGVQPLYFLTDQDIVYQASCNNPLGSSGSGKGEPDLGKGATLGLRIDEGTTVSTPQDIPWWKQTESTLGLSPPTSSSDIPSVTLSPEHARRPFVTSTQLPVRVPTALKRAYVEEALDVSTVNVVDSHVSVLSANDSKALLFATVMPGNGSNENFSSPHSGRGHMFETLMLLGPPDGSFVKTTSTRTPSTPVRVYRTRLRIDYGESALKGADTPQIPLRQRPETPHRKISHPETPLHPDVTHPEITHPEIPATQAPYSVDGKITGYRVDAPLSVKRSSRTRSPSPALAEFGSSPTIRVFIPVRKTEPTSSSSSVQTTTTSSTTTSTTTDAPITSTTTDGGVRATKWWEAVVYPSVDDSQETTSTSPTPPTTSTTVRSTTTTRRPSTASSTRTKLPTRPTPWWWKKTLATGEPESTTVPAVGSTKASRRATSTEPPATTTTVAATTTTTTQAPSTTTEPKFKVKMEILSNAIVAPAVLVNSPIALQFSSSVKGRVAANQMSLISCQVEPTRSRFAYGPVDLIENGCSSDGVGLVEPIEQTRDGIVVRMGPLRYTDSAETMYTCKVRVCKIQCPTFSCLGSDARPYISYGRRRRRRRQASQIGRSTSGIPDVPINFDTLRANLPAKLSPNSRPSPAGNLAFPSGTRGSQIPQSRFLNARRFSLAQTPQPTGRSPLVSSPSRLVSASSRSGLGSAPFFNALGAATNAWANVDYEEIELTQKLVVLNSQYALNYYLKTGLILPEEEQQFSSG